VKVLQLLWGSLFGVAWHCCRIWRADRCESRSPFDAAIVDQIFLSAEAERKRLPNWSALKVERMSEESIGSLQKYESLFRGIDFSPANGKKVTGNLAEKL
jgi:hypothetical protein